MKLSIVLYSGLDDNIFLDIFIKYSMIKQLKDGAYEYNEAEFLGEGAFAKVYKGIIVKNKRVVAIRMLPLKLIKQYGSKIKHIIQDEVNVLKELSQSSSKDSIFAMRIYDCFLTENNVTMILQYCPDGNLEGVIGSRGVRQSQATDMIYQIARGIEFISKQKVVHRDIKPDNIFIRKQNQYTLYKLGDFGFAVKKQMNDQIVGTPIFMSPEIFREEEYGSQVDVWAFGLLCHYILFKQYYFLAASEKEVKKRVLNQRYQLTPRHMQRISKQMANFLSGCLQFDKKNRTNAQQLSKHPVFDKVRDKVEKMVSEIQLINSMTQSQIQKKTVKGIIANLIMSYKFLYRLAGELTKKDRYNLQSLYMIKYNIGELSHIKELLLKKENFINHKQWKEFTESKSYGETSMLLKAILDQHLQCFERQYNFLMESIQKNYGKQVVQGIQKNLGNGPFDRINPIIISQQMKKKWIFRLKQQNNPVSYTRAMECLISLLIYDKRELQLNYTFLEINNQTVDLKLRCQMLEKQLSRHK